MHSAFCDHGMLHQVADKAGLKSKVNARLLEVGDSLGSTSDLEGI